MQKSTGKQVAPKTARKPTATKPDVIAQLEREKTLRLLIISIVFTTCFSVACCTFIKYASVTRPWWQYMVMPGLPPLFWLLPNVAIMKWFRRYITQHHDRVVKLEKGRDPDRKSSGLNKDGSYEHD